MIGSDDDDSFDEPNNGNVSLNETANSIHQQNIDQDKEMAALDEPLIRFIQEQLIVKFKLDDLEHEEVFRSAKILHINPIPWLYFIPHHILVFDKGTTLEKLRDWIERLKKEHYSMSYFREREELCIKAHSKAELAYYNIRMVRTDEKLHRMRQFLDKKHLIDKLYQYYVCYYDKLYFEQTAILILYWAHQKELLDEELNEHCLKLIIICNFINFGYGVANVIHEQLNNKEVLKENNKMYAYTRINQKGETEIDQELVQRYANYTIQEKRGFYMASKKKFMQIKDIVPICFPILPLPREKDEKERAQVEKHISFVLRNERERMSICKNIFKIFKFLHNKFDKRMKLVVDFEETLAYRQEFAESFELQILHPVLNSSICKIEGHSIRKLQAQINSIYEGFAKSSEPIAHIKEMLTKKRKIN